MAFMAFSFLPLDSNQIGLSGIYTREQEKEYVYVINDRQNKQKIAIKTHECHESQTYDRTQGAHHGHGFPLENVTQPVTGQDADQARHVYHAGHDSPESRFANLSDVRVRRAIGETQTHAHRYGRPVQHGNRVCVPQQHPAEDAGNASQNHARLLSETLLRIPGQATTDRLTQIEYTP